MRDLTSSHRSEQEAGYGQNDEDKEQDLGDAHSACGNAAKAEQGSDQGDDKENNGVVQHDVFLVVKSG